MKCKIVLCLCFFFCYVPSIAQNTVWDGIIPETNYSYTFSGGDGTEDFPYLISTAADLAQLAKNVNSSKDYNYSGTCFQLTADLDMNGTNNKLWTPIGFNSIKNATHGSKHYFFNGVFDGNGHTVKNVKISISPSSVTSDDQRSTWGLFGVVGCGGDASEPSQIRNLVIEGMTISLDWNKDFIIKDGMLRIGCLVGMLGMSSSVVDCIVKNSTITTNDYTYSMASGTPGLFVGGIVGDVANVAWGVAVTNGFIGINIENCFSDVDIQLAKIDNNNANGQVNVGGIVGRLRSANQYPVNCVYTGSIVADGIVGAIFGAGRFADEALNNPTGYSSTFNGGASSATVTNNWYYGLTINEIPITGDVKTVQQGVDAGGTATSFATPTTTYQAYQGICTDRPATELSSLNGLNGANSAALVVPSSGHVHPSTYNYTSTLQMFEDYDPTNYIPHYIFANNTFSFLTVSLNETSAGSRVYQAVLTDGATGVFTYHWQIDGNVVSGNGNSYTVPVVPENHTLTVIVKEGDNVVATKSIIVPCINLRVRIVSVVSGSSNTLTAQVFYDDILVTGNTFSILGNNYTISYQWYEAASSNPISGQTSAVFVGSVDTDYKLRVTLTPTSGSNIVMWKYFLIRKVIYVSNSGNDANDGLSPDEPVQTLLKAFQLLPPDANRTWDDNIIVLMNSVNDENVFNQDWCLNSNVPVDYAKNVTITGKHEGNTYDDAKLVFFMSSNECASFFWGDIRFENIKLHGSKSGSLRLYMQGHDFYAGEGISVSGVQDLKYESTTGGYQIGNKAFKDISVLGGWLNYNKDYNSVDNLPYLEGHLSHLTFCSGNFGRVIGGGRNENINPNQYSQNVFGHKDRPWQVEINVLGTAEINLIAGGQCDGTIYSHSVINIAGGLVGRVLGGSLSFARNSNGAPVNSYFGSSSINITGGTIYEIYGGSLGRVKVKESSDRDNTFYYGEVDLFIAGGTVERAIYAGGAGGVMGYDENNGDPYKSWGKNYESTVRTKIFGGTIIGDVFGGGYGCSEYLSAAQALSNAGSLYGDSEIQVLGGTINGSVYGGGKGYYYDDLHAVAQLHGNTSVIVTNGTITGNVFGGGCGVSDHPEVAIGKVYGETSVRISGGTIGLWSGASTGGNVYGGPDLSEMEGTANVEIIGGKTRCVFGGGRSGAIIGNAQVIVSQGAVIDSMLAGGGEGRAASVARTNVIINNATIKGCVLGGGHSGDVTNDTHVSISGDNTIINGYSYYRSQTFSSVSEMLQTDRYYVLNGENHTLAFDFGVWKNGYSFSASTTYYTKELLCVAGGGYGASGYGGGGGGDNGGNVGAGGCYVMINGGTFGEISLAEGKTMGDVFGGGLRGNVTGNTSVTINGSPLTTVIHNNVYGGGLYGSVLGAEGSTLNLNGGTALNALGGSWRGNVSKSMLTLQPVRNEDLMIVESVYAGSECGNVVGTATVQMDAGYVGFYPFNHAVTPYAGYIAEGLYDYGSPVPNTYRLYEGNVFGGGYGYSSTINKSEVHLNGGIVKNSVYGGSELGNTGVDAASLATCIHLDGTLVGGDVYGAGKYGLVIGQTLVSINGSRIEGNVFGGALGSLNTITCAGMKTLNILSGTVMGNVHGGSYNSDDANSTVEPEISSTLETPAITSFINIYGGHLNGDVYGGGFFGRTFGTTTINIGYNAVNNAPRHDDNIYKLSRNSALPLIINGSVFAGSDWGDPTQGNDSNSENSFGYTDIYIDGTGYEQNLQSENYMFIKESLYGSGTVCHGGKMGRSIWLRNYGTRLPSDTCSRTFLSIQRCDNLILDNSHIVLIGQVDATSFENTKAHSLLYVRNAARIANGSSLMIYAPLDSINSLQSVSCSDIYAASPTFTTVNYDGLGSCDNYLRINNGHYVTVRMGGEGFLKYNELKGFFHLNVEDNTKSYIYARRKFSDLNSDDGGFVSYTAAENTFDANGTSVTSGGVQLPYTNRPATRENDHYRYWQYGNGNILRDGVLIARRDPNNTTDTYLTSDCIIELPAIDAIDHYFKLTELTVGDDIYLADTAKSSSDNWMRFNSDGEPNVSTGQTVTNVAAIDARPNSTFGLVMIPSGGLSSEGTTGYNPSGTLPAQFLRRGIASETEECLKLTINDLAPMPELKFRITYNNALSANRELGYVNLKVKEYDGDNNYVQTVEIRLLVITLSAIPIDMAFPAYALMKNAGTQHDTYNVKMVLPDFRLNDGETQSDFTLTDLSIENAGGQTIVMQNASWFDSNEGSNSEFGLTFNAAYGSDNSNGWLTMANNGAPIDVTGISIPSGSGIPIGTVDGRRTFSFDFTLHYNGKLNVTTTQKMGSVTFTLRFTNKLGSAGPLDMDVTVEIYRKGTTTMFYLDGVNGDNGYSGRYPDQAKKTLNGVLDMGYTYGDLIFVVNTVTANSNIHLDWDGSCCNHINLMRYPGGHVLSSVSASDPGRFMGPMVVVNKEMSIEEITLDGADTLEAGKTYPGFSSAILPSGSPLVVSTSPLVVVNDGAKLNISCNSWLVNNTNTTNSGSTNLGGGVFLSEHGELTVRDGSRIVDNQVATGQNGGGVYLKSGGKLTVGGDVMIHNNFDAEGSKRNVYLPSALDRIVVGGIGDDKPSGLSFTSSIGITKDIPSGNDTTQVAYSESVDYIMTPLAEPTIIYDDQNIYGLLFNSLWNKNRLYFNKTWASVVTSQPATGYVVDGNGNVTISTSEGLAWLISTVNGINGQTANDFSGKTVSVSNNINMGAHEWVPIGTNSRFFKGTFDVGSHRLDSVHCSLPYLDAVGLFGHVGGNAILEYMTLLNADFGSSNLCYIGVVAGVLHDDATARGCETTGRVITIVDTTMIGGIIGALKDRSSLQDAFSTVHITGTKAGGLVSRVLPDAFIKNCFSRCRYHDASTGPSHIYAGGLVAMNEGTIENCYVLLDKDDVIHPWSQNGTLAGSNSGTIKNCYVSTLEGGFPLVYISESGSTLIDCGYYPYSDMYQDNKVVLSGTTSANPAYVTSGSTTLLDALQNWQEAHAGHDPWMRTYSIINNDFPILKAPVLTTVSSPDNGKTLFYDLTFAHALEEYNNLHGGAVVALYADDDITDTGLTNDDDVIVYINEDVSLLHNDRLKAYVGITMDNSGPGTFAGGDYDWHMVSSSLSNSPIGLKHMVTSKVDYGTVPIHCTMLSEGVFPQEMDFNRWDFYCYYEPEYHWINFKRNSYSHWHEDGAHDNIEYAYYPNNSTISSSTVFGNEEYMIQGKGYMAATADETFLQSPGILSYGDINIPVTCGGAHCTGYNLIGNPYQSRLDFDKFAESNTWNTLEGYTPSYYVIDGDQEGYISYAKGASSNPSTASRYINMHQGFFILANQETTVKFTDAMRVNGTSSTFRGEDEGRPNYPLVNLKVTDDMSRSELFTVELGRPELGGAEKMTELLNAKCLLYSKYKKKDYSLLFMDEPVEYLPVSFEPQENGTFTMTWSTANGTFSYLHLIDNITGLDIDCLTHDSYVFTSSVLDYTSRFKLVFSFTGLDEEPAESQDVIFAFEHNGGWMVNGTGTLQLIDVNGRILYQTDVNDVQSFIELPDLSKGVYLLRLMDGKQLKIQKIIMK